MIRFLRDMSLRLKITVVFVVIVVGGTLVSTAIGSRIVTDAMLGEAQARVQAGLATAQMIYQLHLSRVRREVIRCSRSQRLFQAVAGAPHALPAALAKLQGETSLDFVGFMNSHGERVTVLGKAVGAEEVLWARLLRVVRSEGRFASTEIFSHETLLQEDLALAERARISLAEKDSLDRGLVLIYAQAIQGERGVSGVVYGGMLLNRSTALVDQVREAVFGGDSYGGGKVGVSSIFLGDVRVSGSTMVADHTLGTHVSSE
ncbi:MAG: hypothetical protein JRH20_23325, partial [Deltaproteobacteria bacterium]|nr:hypothetical protein [Deltaproteobacteria bacterium]